ncbi:MAG: hypothetical protein MH252_04700 [Thermosynechococcaceae cyanobacterium MS004]|nr:hypothetical protein [Thermosynechococcaceae cyanobacterium MS004]
MLVPVKSESIVLIRSRIAANGSTSALLRDLREQQEQLKDLVQLAEDWRNLASHVSSLSPSLSELSTPLKNKLSTLGVEAKSIAN